MSTPQGPQKSTAAWRVWSVGVIGAVLGWLVGISPTFKDCMQNQKNDLPYQALHQNPSVIRGMVIRTKLQAVCAEDWTEKNEGAIGVVATIFIAIFTLTLWRATNRLWQSAEHQLAAFKTSIDIANRHGDHMEKMASAANKSADIAERALIEHQRPWIFRDIVTVNWRDRPGHKINDWYISLKWKNIGRSPAMIIQFQFGITDIDLLPETPDYSKCDPLGVVLSLAESADFDTHEVGPAQGIKDDGSVIQYVFWGRLIYAEMNGSST